MPNLERVPSGTPDTVSSTANYLTFIDAVTTYLGRRGYDLTVQHEMAGWANHMRAVNPWHVSPSHDPMQNQLSPKNSFWLRVSRDGETLACIAHRTFHDAHLLDLIETNRLWYSNLHTLHPIKVLDRTTAASVTGTVSLVGGLWVAESERGQGIGTCLSRMCRMVGTLNFGADWHIAIIKKANVERAGGGGYLEHQRLSPLLSGYYPPTDQVMDLSLARMSSGDIAKFGNPAFWPTVLLADDDQQAVGRIRVAGGIG